MSELRHPVTDEPTTPLAKTPAPRARVRVRVRTGVRAGTASQATWVEGGTTFPDDWQVPT
jgi:hypothetical protein